MKLSDFNFSTRDSSEIFEALKGHKDVITEAAIKQHEHLQRQTCSKCGNKLELSFSPSPFHSNDVLPHYIGRCPTCNIDGLIIDG